MCTHAHILIQLSCCACKSEPSVLCKMPNLASQGDRNSWFPPGSRGIEFIPCIARNVLYLFLTLSHRRDLCKVTSDQLLLAGFFPPPLPLEIFAEEKNSNCYPNIHCPLSETISGQISQGDQIYVSHT